jgi:hypothetical protein
MLPPPFTQDQDTIYVIIETPKGSSGKYAFDADQDKEPQHNDRIVTVPVVSHEYAHCKPLKTLLHGSTLIKFVRLDIVEITQKKVSLGNRMSD